MQLRLAAGSVIALATLLSAQGTLPKGHDKTEGNTSAWESFEIGSLFNPSKAVYSYSAKDFPWDAKKAHVIHSLSFRRDGPYSLKGQTKTGAVTKKWAVWLSSRSDVHAARIDLNHFDRSHGSNRTLVFGTIGVGKNVTFPSTPRPTGTAPFNATIRLDRRFVVPANSSALVLEIRSYDATVTAAGWWRADAVRYSTSGWSPGSFTVLNRGQCVTPAITSEINRISAIGSSLGRVYRTLQAPGGKLMLSWLGPRNTQVFKLPGTNCELHVLPSYSIMATLTATSGSYTGVMDFGTIPPLQALVGISLHHQSAFFDAKYPGGVALSRGALTRVGSGFDPSLVYGVTVFSYGIHTAHEHGTRTRSRVVIPDRERFARFATSRHPILRIN